MWSVIVLAFDGPTPMLTIVMPPDLPFSGDRPAFAACGLSARLRALRSLRAW